MNVKQNLVLYVYKKTEPLTNRFFMYYKNSMYICSIFYIYKQKEIIYEETVFSFSGIDCACD